MSRVKNPQNKKRLSLDRDRRNVYGENDKSSRKNISRGKQRSHMKIRRAATQELTRLRGDADESAAMDAEALVKTRTIALRNSGFKKIADRPLGFFIERQRRAQRLRAIRGALKTAKIPLGCEAFLAVEGIEVGVNSGDLARACTAIRKLLKTSGWPQSRGVGSDVLITKRS